VGLHFFPRSFPTRICNWPLPGLVQNRNLRLEYGSSKGRLGSVRFLQSLGIGHAWILSDHTDLCCVNILQTETDDWWVLYFCNGAAIKNVEIWIHPSSSAYFAKGCLCCMWWAILQSRLLYGVEVVTRGVLFNHLGLPSNHLSYHAP
jgi:hypothetical protein